MGPTHVNALLSSINVPVIGDNTLKAREREVGPVIETVAKSSCLAGVEEEKKRWDVEGKGQDGKVHIGASYDMGWQKRGKGHNSLTGRYNSVLYENRMINPLVSLNTFPYFFCLSNIEFEIEVI